MSFLLKTAFVFVLLFALEVQVAQADQSSSTLMKIIDKLPNGDTKNGLKEYVQILGYGSYDGADTVGISNAGLSDYFSNKFEDPKNSCLRDASRTFFEDVAKVLKSRTSQDVECTKDSYPDYGCSQESRPSINSRVGKDPYSDLSKGWLWELALKHAKGDANSAMFLIGMCGHDETRQGSYGFQASSEEKIADLNERKKSLQVRITEYSKDYDKNRDRILALTKQISDWNQEISELQKKPTVRTKMKCPPRNSAYYAPQSIGSSADISEPLKSQIQSTQETADGVTYTPAKYYHVYGAAFMACQLVQNGVSPLKTTFIQQQAARLYRAIRMCESVDSAELKFLDPKSADSSLRAVLDVQNKKVICPLVGNSPRECQLINELGYNPVLIGSGAITPGVDEVKAKWAGKLRNSDAATLYKSWYLGGGEIKGQKIPCSDLRVWGPNDLMKPDANFFDKISKPREWSVERFKSASQKLATWDVDFKWTIAQHKVGAEFASKNCKKRAPGEKPLKGICPEVPAPSSSKIQNGVN
ncbi:hypothetical protein [Bdellovibrio sp. HCB209]|uniref:hypothetical protein n=1 Tax=Bdellovibrio sp. HCB209 TaxID=3394354 RepID=UPI0039B530F4